MKSNYWRRLAAAAVLAAGLALAGVAVPAHAAGNGPSLSHNALANGLANGL